MGDTSGANLPYHCERFRSHCGTSSETEPCFRMAGLSGLTDTGQHQRLVSHWHWPGPSFKPGVRNLASDPYSDSEWRQWWLGMGRGGPLGDGLRLLRAPCGDYSAGGPGAVTTPTGPPRLTPSPEVGMETAGSDISCCLDLDERSSVKTNARGGGSV